MYCIVLFFIITLQCQNKDDWTYLTNDSSQFLFILITIPL